MASQRHDPRRFKAMLLEALRQHGIEIRNPSVITCPACSTARFASVELHGGGVWKMRCRHAACNALLDVFGVRAIPAKEERGAA